MKAGLDWISFSVDGLDEVYEEIRGPLKFKDTVEKIQKYHEIKKKYGSVKPVIKVQGVWPAVEKSNAERFVEVFKPITDQVASGELRDCLRNDEAIEYQTFGPCPVLYQRLTIGSDGVVKLCYNDEMGQVDVGDVNKETLHEIWHGERLERARKLHEKKMGVQEYEPCKWCMYPRKTSKQKTKVKNKTITLRNYTNRTQEIGK
jgi:radical SAM protein with 4Fe4S-binding SPASM domain